MVDGRYLDETGNEPGYTGFMRVDVFCLWFLYGEMGNSSMQEVCGKKIPKDLIPVYDGGDCDGAGCGGECCSGLYI